MQTENNPTPVNVQQPGVMPPKGGPSGTAIAALVLGIIGLLCCGPLTGIPALIIGKMELTAIKEGRADREGQPLAMVGFVLGIVATALTLLLLIVIGFVTCAASNLPKETTAFL